jgi:periplasmic protein TonB
MVGAMLSQAQSEQPDDFHAPPRIGLEDLEADKNEPLTLAEEMPIFRNDPEGHHKYISAHLTYPAEARENNIQGTVFASFVVQKDGSVADVKILRGLHPALDAEVLRVLNAMPPEWKPGMQNGEKVNVRYSVPVRFKLSDTLLIPSKKKKANRRKRE